LNEFAIIFYNIRIQIQTLQQQKKKKEKEKLFGNVEYRVSLDILSTDQNTKTFSLFPRTILRFSLKDSRPVVLNPCAAALRGAAKFPIDATRFEGKLRVLRKGLFKGKRRNRQTERKTNSFVCFTTLT